MKVTHDVENIDYVKLGNVNIITFVLFWTGLVVLCSLYVTIPLLPKLSEIYQISVSQAAWAGSIFSICFAVGCLFFGAISDRYGKKNVMALGLVGLAIVTFMIGLSDSFSQLVVLRGIQGGLAATFSPVALTYVGVMYPPKKRVTTIGIISSGFLIAGIVGQLISSFITALINWNTVFFFFAIVYIFTSIFLWIVIPKDGMAAKDQDLFAIVRKFKISFSHKPLILCNSIGIMVLLTFVGMYTALGYYLSTSFQFDDQKIFYVRAAGIFGIILSPFTGKFVQKFGMKKVLTFGMLCSIIGLFFMGLGQSLPIIIFMSILFVCGIAIIVPSMLALVGQLGGNEKGVATSIYTFILFIGASLGPIIATFILKTGSSTMPFFVFGAILTVGIVLSIMIHSLTAQHIEKELTN
ncbi:MFS transporter [Bacillus benzoevorans]|uniref:Putative MFS family arabinose efflux permease n=1 Tax=Bacillus benzoevorans TaxID=1456 RepID=A0A7X0HVN2_9BACI|nr:MFS transporter [Bacillus benzoevorans]MBB6447727.1 putative MFS family arabinose efflux permease [Bacillus benzoevorans]